MVKANRRGLAATLSFLLALVPPVAHPGFDIQAQESVTRGDIRVNVTRRASDLEGFRSFFVVAINSGTSPRSVHGQIDFPSAGSAAGGTSRSGANCTVYLEIPPGQSSSRTFLCRARSTGQYRFTLKAVYDFILDG